MRVTFAIHALAASLVSALSLIIGCDPVAVDFGEIEPAALANVYFEKTGIETWELGAYCADPASVTQDTYSMSEPEGYQAIWVTSRGTLTLRILHGSRVVDEHTFDRTFLDSGESARHELTLPGGEQFAYTVWGAETCETCPPYAPGDGETCFPETHTKPEGEHSLTPAVVVGPVD